MTTVQNKRQPTYRDWQLPAVHPWERPERPAGLSYAPKHRGRHGDDCGCFTAGTGNVRWSTT